MEISDMSACFCMGPQNGEPHCPCKMRELREAANVINKMVSEGKTISLFQPLDNTFKPVGEHKVWIDGDD